MLKLSKKILPIIGYKFSAKWYPGNTVSNEQFEFDLVSNVASHSDFFSTFYSRSYNDEVVNKKPMYIVPSDLSYDKQHFDWMYLRQGAKRKDIKTKPIYLEKTMLFNFQLTLPLVVKFLDPSFWFNNEVIIPTHYVDTETEQHMCFRCKSLILVSYSIDISVDKVNTIQCTVFGYNPEIVFIDKFDNNTHMFDNWISKQIEIITQPQNIFDSPNIVYSTQISRSSNIQFITYKETQQITDCRYVYVPQKDGTFHRLNGFITLSNYLVDFDAYNWVIVQSHPEYDVSLEVFDYEYIAFQKLSKMQIDFKNQEQLLGRIKICVTDMNANMFRVNISGIGEFECLK